MLAHVPTSSGCVRPARSARSGRVTCNAIAQPVAQPAPQAGRRQMLLGAAALLASSAAVVPQSLAATAAAVGGYLPAISDELVQFVVPKGKTPALRAGTVDPDSPYRFALPKNFFEQKVANIQSGNYCQPRCDEPWTEVIFEGPTGGRVELIVSPLQKLTPRRKVKVEDLGTPEQVLERVGNYITGSYLDEDALIAAASKQLDGQTYYFYELNAPYSKIGARSYTSLTVKGDLAYLFIATASEKNWSKMEPMLKTVVESFRA
ncbi:hypothetical protein HYH03_009304 [Edaphochlamys debaryana]|uniref:PsbP C-terminal domain-containing protein n=1 Tax=Edaphochlamys debaryana TaxID=47281 RepID=A0A836BX46_9CHLO|nr:hypothetical protein HYH03_009304 [Edaphochlamys debaryana]|eukprot:KAG2492356.1 hypothetical protein HYH03_009304 [Edaphochlamys debaryana]